MKILVRSLLIGFVAASVFAQTTYEYTSRQWEVEEWVEEEEPVNEFAGYFLVGFPGQGDFDLYKSTYGVGVQYRNWSWDPFGFALDGGIYRTEADSSSDSVLPEEKGSFDGDIIQYPLGASALYQLYFSEEWGVTFELGLRYVFITSNMEYTWKDTGEKEDVDVGHGFILVAALDGDYALNEAWRVFGGVGLQQDIVKGKLSLADEDLRDNELKGFFARFGIRYIF
ncbi:MAG: hypothetical protein EOM20_10425 [Spartobacteria bacterium]|nr:hypothetical protein [Spartobacteria bacterium]